MPRLSGDSSTIWILLLLTIVGLYLFSQFTETKDDKLTYTEPTDIGATTMMALKIIIIGAVAVGMFYIFIKVGKGSLSGRDFATIAFTIVLVWFMWDWFLKDFLKAPSINEMAVATAQKLGLA